MKCVGKDSFRGDVHWFPLRLPAPQTWVIEVKEAVGLHLRPPAFIAKQTQGTQARLLGSLLEGNFPFEQNPKPLFIFSPQGKRSANRPGSGGAALRGGNWNNGSLGGAFTLNLNNAPSNSNTNIGFRCVFRLASRLEVLAVKEAPLDSNRSYGPPSLIDRPLKAPRPFSWAPCEDWGNLILAASEQTKHLLRTGETDFWDGGAARRGGNWNNGSLGGAFSLILNKSPSNTSSEIGFRCVFLATGRLGV